MRFRRNKLKDILRIAALRCLGDWGSEGGYFAHFYAAYEARRPRGRRIVMRTDNLWRAYWGHGRGFFSYFKAKML